MPDLPLVIAHRGASGYLPEHTLAAKVLAYGQGADFLEQDVVMSRDGVLVVLHDLHLDDVSDVVDCFPGREREDGRSYVIDFDVAELKQLTLEERRRPGSSQAQFPGRFAAAGGDFRISTLADEIELIKELNRSTGRSVGIYPEIKAPQWHARHRLDLGAQLLDLLDDFGYRSHDDDVFVQCFDRAELERLRPRSSLKFVQLLDRDQVRGLDKATLATIGSYAEALGPPYVSLMETEPLRKASSVDTIAAAGLALHPYTFRRDQLPAGVENLESLLRFFYAEIGVGGVFCDHPDVAVRVRRSLGGQT